MRDHQSASLSEAWSGMERILPQTEAEGDKRAPQKLWVDQGGEFVKGVFAGRSYATTTHRCRHAKSIQRGLKPRKRSPASGEACDS